MNRLSDGQTSWSYKLKISLLKPREWFKLSQFRLDLCVAPTQASTTKISSFKDIYFDTFKYFTSI